MNIRKANSNEADLLNRIAYESEAIWGEDAQYMALFSQTYKVTEDMIKEDYVYIMENEGVVIGFFAVLTRTHIPELELFYIEKSFIGKGYGTILWKYMIELCKENKISKIELVGSKDVVNFYIKCGAREIEKIKSTLKSGRIVSRLVYIIY